MVDYEKFISQYEKFIEGEAGELKPCPFCGGKAFINKGYILYWVSCQECGVEGSARKSNDEAIQAWNTRAERTCRNKSRFAPGGTRFVCSACDFGSDWDMWDDNCGVPMDFWFDYCPNCGAKVIDKVVEE